jgi:hypothetical protein
MTIRSKERLEKVKVSVETRVGWELVRKKRSEEEKRGR